MAYLVRKNELKDLLNTVWEFAKDAEYDWKEEEVVDLALETFLSFREEYLDAEDPLGVFEAAKMAQSEAEAEVDEDEWDEWDDDDDDDDEEEEEEGESLLLDDSDDESILDLYVVDGQDEPLSDEDDDDGVLEISAFTDHSAARALAHIPPVSEERLGVMEGVIRRAFTKPFGATKAKPRPIRGLLTAGKPAGIIKSRPPKEHKPPSYMYSSVSIPGHSQR